MLSPKEAANLLIPSETYIRSRFMTTSLPEGDVMFCVDQPRFFNGEHGPSVELDINQKWQDAIEAIYSTTSEMVPTSEL